MRHFSAQYRLYARGTHRAFEEGRDGDVLPEPFPIVSTRPCEVGGEVSQEFAWQFYAGLAAMATELHRSTWLVSVSETANHDAGSAARLTAITSDLARWDDDGGAPPQPRQPRTVSAKSSISKGLGR